MQVGIMSDASANNSSSSAAPSSQLHIAVEQEQRGHQNACTVVSNQRSPRLSAERDSIKETTCPIRCDYFAFWPLPEDRIELLGSLSKQAAIWF